MSGRDRSVRGYGGYVGRSAGDKSGYYYCYSVLVHETWLLSGMGCVQ
jgi:hypothetical protein